MRLIGHMDSENLASRVSGLFVSQGIPHQMEADDGPRWALWVHSEEDLERARTLFAAFRANPDDPRFRTQVTPRMPVATDGAAESAEAPRKVRERSRSAVESRGWDGAGGIAVTVVVLVVCVALGWVTGLGVQHPWVGRLQVSEVPFAMFSRFARWELFLPEVRKGEIWRLFTPALLHFGWPHILFNLWNFWDLGRMIEFRRGSLRLAGMIVGFGVVSNLGQYLVSGPNFGGMSGVIYAMLGYAWMMGKYRPSAGIGLHPQVVVMMLVWFVICFTDALGVPVANTAHAVGLVSGVAWGRWVASRG